MLYAEMMARRSTTAAGNAAMCLFPIVSGLGYESLGGNDGDLPLLPPKWKQWYLISGHFAYSRSP